MGSERFYIESLQAVDLEHVQHMESKIFVEQNAVIKRMGLNAEDFHDMAGGDSYGCEKQGMSLVMRDREADNKIVAFVLGHKMGSARDAPFSTIRKLLRKYPLLWDFAFMLFPTKMRALLLYPSFLWVQCQGRVARCTAGGTLAGYEGMGLQYKLRTKFIALVRQLGYDRVIVETISPATCHLWGKFGFQALAYKPWNSRKRKDGPHPFEDLQGGLTIHELVLRRRPVWNASTFLLMLGVVVALLKAAKKKYRRFVN